MRHRQLVNDQANAQDAAPNLGNLSATLPTLFSIEGFMMWNFWSVYMSAELKSASNRGRQIQIMFGALFWDGLLLIIGVWLLFRIAGAWPVPSAPGSWHQARSARWPAARPA